MLAVKYDVVPLHCICLSSPSPVNFLRPSQQTQNFRSLHAIRDLRKKEHRLLCAKTDLCFKRFTRLLNRVRLAQVACTICLGIVLFDCVQPCGFSPVGKSSTVPDHNSITCVG